MYSHLLSSEQIQLRLDIFNETNDWSVFNDVPPIQQVSVMYPHRILTFEEMKNPPPKKDPEEIKKMYERLRPPEKV